MRGGNETDRGGIETDIVADLKPIVAEKYTLTIHTIALAQARQIRTILNGKPFQGSPKTYFPSQSIHSP